MNEAPQQKTKERSAEYSRILADIDRLLENGDEVAIDKFIDDRLADLEAHSKEGTITLFASKKLNQGFIHPKTEVKRVHVMNGFTLDDRVPYRELIDKLLKLKKAEGTELRALTLRAIQWELVDYFGNIAISPEKFAENLAYYSDHSGLEDPLIPLKEFKGKGMAVCVEKSALAQNLLTFLGGDAYMVMSEKCEISGEPSEGGHAYTILATSKGYFIFDASNPALTFNESGQITDYFPAVYQITEDQFRAIQEGGQVSVEHRDIDKSDGQGGIRTSTRVYGG